AHAQSFHGIGLLPGGTATSINGISADGSVVVGSADTSNGARAFRWTADQGIMTLGVLPGSTSSGAVSVSRDGSIVVGTSSGSGNSAFRWTAATGMLPLPPRGFDEGGGVSADGAVVAGPLDYGSPELAFRWTSPTGQIGLQPVTGGVYTFATGVSGDGTVVV